MSLKRKYLKIDSIELEDKIFDLLNGDHDLRWPNNDKPSSKNNISDRVNSYFLVIDNDNILNIYFYESGIPLNYEFISYKQLKDYFNPNELLKKNKELEKRVLELENELSDLAEKNIKLMSLIHDMKNPLKIDPYQD